MKIGDYVRTKNGIIGKFNIVKTRETIPNWNGGYGYKEIDKEYIDNNIYNRYDDKIIKSSPNIIGLIEEGDYVNGLEITSITEKSDICEERVLYHDHDDDFYGIYANEIKSIVTKEQFESMEYRIGEES